MYFTFEVSKDSALPVIPLLSHKTIRQRKWFISLIALLISPYHSNRKEAKVLGQNRTLFSSFLVLSKLVFKISGAIGQTWINIIHQMTESQIVQEGRESWKKLFVIKRLYNSSQERRGEINQEGMRA